MQTRDLLSLLTEPTLLKLTVAESLTSGHVQAAIGKNSGISAAFQGGITAYNLEVKVKFLGIDAPHAAEVDCVSLRVAKEMAVGVCKLFESELGLATTGYAEAQPSRGYREPTAYWAICHHQQGSFHIADSGKCALANAGRVKMQQFVTDHVIEYLIDYLVSFRLA